MNPFMQEFIDAAIYRIDESCEKINRCLDELEDADIWKRPNKNSNSTGNIILHLCGNIRQYAISSLGNVKDVRERDKEFAADGGHSKSQLREKLMSTIEEARTTIK